MKSTNVKFEFVDWKSLPIQNSNVIIEKYQTRQDKFIDQLYYHVDFFCRSHHQSGLDNDETTVVTNTKCHTGPREFPVHTPTGDVIGQAPLATSLRVGPAGGVTSSQLLSPSPKVVDHSTVEVSRRKFYQPIDFFTLSET